MSDGFHVWLSDWLPLIQGFAAIASIGGAVLSWKYALKAERAREQMTQNIVTSRLIESFDNLVTQLHEFRGKAVLEDGKPDHATYRLLEQHHMRLLDEAAALSKAATPYLKTKPNVWGKLLDDLSSAANYPTANNIERACKSLISANAELKLAATTREMGPGT